jgi:lysozyme family protein
MGYFDSSPMVDPPEIPKQSDGGWRNAISLILLLEGGFVDNPLDRGGPTNHGITMPTLSSWRKKQVTRDDIRSLDQQEARQIYRAFYWDAPRIWQIPNEGLKTAVFDQAVHSGHVRAVALLQTTLNRVNNAKLATDGLIGPKTLGVCERSEYPLMTRRYIQAARLRYATIVQNDPSQSVFIRGWMNRSHVVENFILS